MSEQSTRQPSYQCAFYAGWVKRNALTEMICKTRRCPFFKTPEEMAAARKETERINRIMDVRG